MNSFLDQFEGKSIYQISDSDLDGVSAYMVSKVYLEPICESFTYTLTSKRDMSEFSFSKAMCSGTIIFTDITPTVALYNKLTMEMKKEVWIFDHHIGPRDELLTVIKDKYFFTTEKCGTKIYFDELTKGLRVKKVVYEYVERCDLYDRFVTGSALWKDAKDLHNVMYGYVDWFSNQPDDIKYDQFINMQLNKFKDAKYFYLTDYEKQLAFKAEKKERDNLEQAIKSMQVRLDNSNNNYAYFECSSKLSLVAMSLTKRYPNIKYFIGHSTFREKARNELNGTVSLRCSESFDVSLIAQKHGGNGHKQASGIDLPLDVFYKLREGKIHLI